MDGLSPAPDGATTDYQPIGNCESDDSQSNASKSDDNDIIPGIIYTSDDSADVGQSDSTYIDSDAPHYFAESVNQGMDDEFSRQFLLVGTSSQASPQISESFIGHPLASITLNGPLNNIKDGLMAVQNKNQLYVEHPKVLIQVNPGEGRTLTRCNSSSSSSTEAEFTPEVPFLSAYEPLPSYPDDEGYSGGLNFESLKDDPVKTQVIHEQLNHLTSCKEDEPHRTGHRGRFYIGSVHIDPAYRDAFYVKWNWPKIRQTCVFINLSFLIGFLCVGVGMLLQMPVDSECNPVQEWWQGTVSYYIYVPSFLDTNDDGIGDIKGVISKLDYIEELGVKTVRLAPVFERADFLKKFSSPINYSSVSKVLGDDDDLQLLAALLHERNMFLMLDLPLVNKDTGESLGVLPSPAIEMLSAAAGIIQKWTDLGADGFALTDIDRLAHADNLLHALHNWRSILMRKNRRIHRRVLMVPLNLLKIYEQKDPPSDLAHLLNLVDLIDVHLQINQSAEKVAQLIKEATHWDSSHSLPWINWNLGGVGYKRLAEYMSAGSNFYDYGNSTVASVPTLGPIIFQMFLPGSVTIYYGDEIGAPDIQSSHHKDMPWASLMTWSSSSPNGGFSDGEPLLPLRDDWETWNVASLNFSLNPLRVMVKVRQQKVPLYINGIFGNVGDYHPTKTTNYKIRFAAENLLIFDRFYPRRNKYTVVINLGTESLERDLSKLYYGGEVLASSHGKTGYIRFHDIALDPGEALACVLDK